MKVSIRPSPVATSTVFSCIAETSAGRAQQAERVRQSTGSDSKAFAQPGQSVQVGEPAVDKSLGVDKTGRAVVEPVQRRGSLDAGQRGALRIKAEIRGVVTDPVPYRIDGVVEQPQGQRRIL